MRAAREHRGERGCFGVARVPTRARGPGAVPAGAFVAATGGANGARRPWPVPGRSLPGKPVVMCAARARCRSRWH